MPAQRGCKTSPAPTAPRRAPRGASAPRTATPKPPGSVGRTRAAKAATPADAAGERRKRTRSSATAPRARTLGGASRRATSTAGSRAANTKRTATTPGNATPAPAHRKTPSASTKRGGTTPSRRRPARRAVPPPRLDLDLPPAGEEAVDDVGDAATEATPAPSSSETYVSAGSTSLHTAPATPSADSLCSARSDDVCPTPLACMAPLPVVARALVFSEEVGGTGDRRRAACEGGTDDGCGTTRYGAALGGLVVRYHALLGEGGHGAVYKGTLNGAAVAVKTMRYADMAGLAPATAASMARNEADMHAAVAARPHPHVVALLGAAVTPEDYTIVTELCDAVTLQDEIAAGRYATWGTRLGWLRDVARGAAHVHACGMVHRDLKPANVLFSAGAPAVARVADFGLAARVGDACGETVGTPGYVAPEVQAPHAGGSSTVATAQDVYALGAMLVEVATGVELEPFPTWVRDTADLRRLAVRMRAGATRVAPPAGARLPGSLRAIIDRCLAVDPAERPSMAAVAALLDAECGTPYADDVFCAAVEGHESLWVERESLEVVRRQ